MNLVRKAIDDAGGYAAAVTADPEVAVAAIFTLPVWRVEMNGVMPVQHVRAATPEMARLAANVGSGATAITATRLTRVHSHR